jgi:hypothetical protein
VFNVGFDDTTFTCPRKTTANRSANSPARSAKKIVKRCIACAKNGILPDDEQTCP